jgi:hypothetical protein
MISDKDEVRVIKTYYSGNPVDAAIDAKIREAAAREKYADFFNSAEHVNKVSQVQAILEKFFDGRYRRMYTTARPGRGKPFTSIKVEVPIFPNTKSKEARQAEYYQPLRDLGVDIKFSANTNSYLYTVT